MKTIEVSENCVCCGICTQKTELLVEDESGKAVPAARYIIKTEELPTIEAIAAECPVNAIHIVAKYEEEKFDKAALKQMLEELKKEFEAIPKLTINYLQDIEMKAENYQINTPEPEGEWEHDYSSKQDAKEAAVDELDRIAISQSENIITEVLIQYREDKLRKYYTLDKDSFWGEANGKFEKILVKFANEIEGRSNGEIVLPEKFSKFEAFPGYEKDLMNNSYTHRLVHIDSPYTSEKIMKKLKTQRCYDKNAYLWDASVYSKLEYVGESFWRDSPWEERWCYCSVGRLVNEYIKSLCVYINCCDIFRSRGLGKVIEEAIEAYYEKVEEMVGDKLQMLIEAIKKSGIKALQPKTAYFYTGSWSRSISGEDPFSRNWENAWAQLLSLFE